MQLYQRGTNIQHDGLCKKCLCLHSTLVKSTIWPRNKFWPNPLLDLQKGRSVSFDMQCACNPVKFASHMITTADKLTIQVSGCVTGQQLTFPFTSQVWGLVLHENQSLSSKNRVSYPTADAKLHLWKLLDHYKKLVPIAVNVKWYSSMM